MAGLVFCGEWTQFEIAIVESKRRKQMDNLEHDKVKYVAMGSIPGSGIDKVILYRGEKHKG